MVWWNSLLEERFRVWIDHLAHGPGLKALRVQGISRKDDTGKRLSDHNGVMVELEKNRVEIG
jgi:hypothetical protein